MPARDKTGPRGSGPMSGRGMGSCNDGSEIRSERGRGMGLGSGRGRQRGFGRFGRLFGRRSGKK
ncbi:MAG: DUF5320 domain-containing protein [Clostridiaceae bacterium]|jgi:hypothetical protein|nr:DUF5320 domain-containing protein [Clostridiaceae bacterium]